jgi:putative transposase
MARLARVVAAGVPHHVTQRGNRRQPTFFVDDDYRSYLDLLGVACRRFGVELWAYCLMPNHVHLIAMPEGETGLRLALGEAHRRYTRAVNARQGWVGHLWQGRFASCALDDAHVVAAARYVELNPVRARLTRRARDWPWSSARAHLAGRDDGVVKVRPLLDAVGDWRAFLSEEPDAALLDGLRRHERTGRPLGSDAFVAGLEAALGRELRPRKPGRKPRQEMKETKDRRPGAKTDQSPRRRSRA